jgi:UDP-glucose 4-epimerase
MPLRDSVALVRYAFEHAQQGDLFIRKAPAATLQDLVAAMKDLFSVPTHPVEIIGWRHAEKLYETLATAQELTNCEDLGDYYRIKMDGRDLNYSAYFNVGDREVVQHEDYHSHNSVRLDAAGVKELLLTLPEFRAELAAWSSDRS